MGKILHYQELQGTLKVGDIVRAVPSKMNGCSEINDNGSNTGTITSAGISGFSINGCSHSYSENSWLELVNQNTASNMNLIEKAKRAFKSEPEKSFIKAGVMDSNENLTSDGQALFLTYLLKKNGEDFKATVIDPILKAEETVTTK